LAVVSVFFVRLAFAFGAVAVAVVSVVVFVLLMVLSFLPMSGFCVSSLL
jgi:hypothetical protein